MRTPRAELVHLLPRHRLQELDELGAQRVLRVVVVLRLAGADHGGRGNGRGEVDLADGGDEGDDFDAVGFLEVVLGDGAGGDTACEYD